MIDLHTHILPFSDDGAESIPEALEMARLAQDDGTAIVFCTPHQMDETDRTQQILARVKKLQKKTTGILLVPGMEVLLQENTMPLIRKKKVLPLNGSRYLLCEFNFEEDDGREEWLKEVRQSGFVPVIAHPERYPFFTLTLAEHWKADGALLQLNSHSVTGQGRPEAVENAVGLLQAGLADFVGSDGHDHRHRTPCLGLAYGMVDRQYGSFWAEKLFQENPSAVYDNRRI